MRTLKLTLAYDGTRFVGWQRQAEGESIQGLLEDALARFEGAPVTVHGAGRTDAGVHALGQVASVRVTCSHDVATLTRALNAQLPEDLRVLSVEEAPSDFHARFSAKSKTYRYMIRNGSDRDAVRACLRVASAGVVERRRDAEGARRCSSAHTISRLFNRRAPRRPEACAPFCGQESCSLNPLCSRIRSPAKAFCDTWSAR